MRGVVCMRPVLQSRAPGVQLLVRSSAPAAPASDLTTPLFSTHPTAAGFTTNCTSTVSCWCGCR